MKQRFPMLASWTTIHRIGPNRTEVINELTDESFITDQGEAYIQFITSLHENVNPYYIPAGYTIKERFAILNELSAHLLLREDRWLSKSLDSVMYSCYIPKTHQSGKRLFSVLNTLLYLLFLPALIGGLVRFFSSGTELHSLSIPGIACGILLGIVLHEAAHAIAGLSYGGKLFEAGVSMTYIFIPGAYVLIKGQERFPVLKQLQTYAAGIEMNALLSGCFFFLAPAFPLQADFFFCAAWVNLITLLVNLTMIDGNDGCKMFSLLFGRDGEDIVEKAREYITTPSKRAYLRSLGLRGKVTFCAYSIVLLMQTALPLLIVLNLLEVIAWFV